MRKTRSYIAGVSMAESIIDMVHLMYQNKTAYRFLSGIINRLGEEFIRRKQKEK